MQQRAPSRQQQILSTFWISSGSLLAAIAIRIFLAPRHLIDGGIVGISQIFARFYGMMPLFLFLFNLPFIYLAHRYIRRRFVLHMLTAVLMFGAFFMLLNHAPPFTAEPLEAIVIGGAILGIGSGLIIRHGGCLDGTEILAILINRQRGFTIGQVILVINIFIFSAYGWLFQDWHIALQSLMTYIVAFQMIDLVIVGLDDMKSILIISAKPKELSKAITKELGIGSTIIHGRSGLSGESRTILFIIIERLDLAGLKAIVVREDPTAFMAIENLHEVVHGKTLLFSPHKRSKRRAKP